MLMTETNTRAMSERIIRAAKVRLGSHCYKTDFEHGQWWVTRPSTGEQWSVVDCQTTGGVDYLDFEGEVEAESEEEAISLANSGEVEDNDPTYLGTLDDETTAKLVEETEA